LAVQFDALERDLPPGCVHKASQWLLLSRTHALAVLSLLQRFHRREARSSNPSVPPLGQDLFALFDVKGASDEMFFPCCLAVLGYINPPAAPPGKGENGTTSGASGQASRAQVLRKQITYADWRGQAKNPIRYTAFPAALTQKITTAGLHGASAAATAAAGSKRRHHGSSEEAEEPEVDSTQQDAVFLRKIQFPANPGSLACREAQRAFLQDWLRCLLAQLNPTREVKWPSAAAGPHAAGAVPSGMDWTYPVGTSFGNGFAGDSTAFCKKVTEKEQLMQRGLQLCEEMQRYAPDKRIL
jgi:hypothetical protein